MSYSAAFKSHLTQPRNVGELADANAVGEQTNPVCGDRLRLSMRIDEKLIGEVRFLAYGCPPTLVCGSALTSLLEGVTVDQAMQLTKKDLLNEVGGLPSRKQHAAALAIETLRTALETACSKILP